MSNNIFVLSLDVDETVLNSKTPKEIHSFDFNGGEDPARPTAWLALIEDIKEMCEAQGLTLVVNLISAKNTGTVDDTIDACHKRFKQFLAPYKKDGTQHSLPHSNQYLAQRHLDKERPYELFDNWLIKKPPCSDGGQTYEAAENILPAIHICNQNNPQTGEMSKALVLEKIRAFYDISENQMLHVDNSRGVQNDLATGAGGQTPSFRCVDSHRLEELQYERDRSTRSEVTEQIIEEIKTQAEELILAYSSITPALRAEEELLPLQPELPEVTKEPSSHACENIKSEIIDGLLEIIESEEREYFATLSCVNPEFCFFEYTFNEPAYENLKQLLLCSDLITQDDLKTTLHELESSGSTRFMQLAHSCKDALKEQSSPHETKKLR